MKTLHISAAAAIGLASLASADLTKIVKVDISSQQFIDAQGRSRHFHGTNMVKKGFPWHEDPDNFDPGYSVSDRDIKYLKDMNVNCIRLGVHWAGVEPVRGQYNQTYLDVSARIIKKLQDNGIYTLVDHHQDVWASQLCGHGAPDWFVHHDWVIESHRMPYPQKAPFQVDARGVPSSADCGSIDWGKSYLDYAVGNAFGRLYNNYDGLGDSWAAYWKVVTQNVYKLPGVMGYDLMNEPWVGDHMADPTLLIPGVADHKTLEGMWNKGNTAIRSVDDTTIVMFEGATWDILSGFNGVPGGDGSKTAQSYHYYNPPQLGSFESTVQNRIKDNNRLKTTGMLTEFEIWDRSDKGIAGSLETTRVADKYLQSWTAWAYEEIFNRTAGADAAPYPSLVLIYARTYAEATAGVTKSSFFEDITGKYWVSWTANTAIEAPGLIRIVPNAYYPDGVRVVSNPPGAIKMVKENENVLQLHYDKASGLNGQTITASVQPYYPTGPLGNHASGGMCIDVWGGGVPSANNAINLNSCTPSQNQVWKFKNGRIEIAFDINHESGKYCLDTQPVPNQPFQLAVLNTCQEGSHTQQWNTTSNGNVVNVATGNCLDIEGSKYKSGSRILSFACGNGQPNQVWTLPNGVDGNWVA